MLTVIIMMTLLSIVGGYIVTSLLLFKYPHIIHKRKEMKFRCQHISHRGGAAENTENTIQAFKHAVRMGTDMLELDVHITKDGEVVVSHDNNLLRASGINIDISDCNYQDLPLLSSQIPVDFDIGKIHVGSQDRKIPLLKEVYANFPTIPINIDIKRNNDVLIQKVAAMTREFKREEQTVWGNVSDKITQKCYSENPQMPVLFSMKRVLILLLFTYSGLLPFVSLRESCLEVFMPSIIHKNVNSMFNQKRSYRIILWALDKLLMRKAVFEHLNKRGIQTYLWVLNEDEEFDRAFKLGATGVMTDYPTRLRSFLDRNPQYRDSSTPQS